MAPRDSELNDAYGLIVDLKADKVLLTVRIEALEELLEQGRAILSNEAIIKLQADLVGQVVFASWSERVDVALAAKKPPR